MSPAPHHHGLRGTGIHLNRCAFSVSDNLTTNNQNGEELSLPISHLSRMSFLVGGKNQRALSYLFLSSFPQVSREKITSVLFSYQVYCEPSVPQSGPHLSFLPPNRCSLLPLLKLSRFLVPCFFTESLYSRILHWVKLGWWFDEKANYTYVLVILLLHKPSLLIF